MKVVNRTGTWVCQTGIVLTDEMCNRTFGWLIKHKPSRLTKNKNKTVCWFGFDVEGFCPKKYLRFYRLVAKRDPENVLTVLEVDYVNVDIKERLTLNVDGKLRV
jgi:hypothetical protein